MALIVAAVAAATHRRGNGIVGRVGVGGGDVEGQAAGGVMAVDGS